MTLNDFAHRIYFFFESSIIFYLFALNVIYLFLTISAFFVMRRQQNAFSATEQEGLLNSPLLPSIALIVPAYNEAGTVRESVPGKLRLNYPNYEVIVVNDGSKDATMQILLEACNLYRSSRSPAGPLHTAEVRAVYESTDSAKLIVVDKANGGKADAINVGINMARADFIMVVDCDSLIEPDGLFQMIKPYLEDPERVIAIGGTVRAVNDCSVAHGYVEHIRTAKAWLPNFQAIEYLRAFFGGRIGFSLLNSLLIIAGAYGLFRRDAVLEAGGYDESSIGEDMELVVRLHHLWRQKGIPYRIAHAAQPVCWTEVPDSMKILQRQRKRWQRGTYESLWRHREMLMNPKYGTVGMFSFTYFFLFEMLGPAIESLGYVLTIMGLVFDIIAPSVAILFFSVSIVTGILLSTSALLLEEFSRSRYPEWRHSIRMFFAAILENFGFRQMLTIWRLQGLIEGIKGKKGGWGEMTRKGFGTTAAKPV